MPEPAADVMSLSADDDDQADQQHQLDDPAMAETDRSLSHPAPTKIPSNVFVKFTPVNFSTVGVVKRQ